jgi:hypothetical protein
VEVIGNVSVVGRFCKLVLIIEDDEYAGEIEQTPKSGWQLSKQCSFDTPQ